MTYIFKSSVTGNLTMLSKDAETILKIVGKSPSPKGIITSEQISGAISALQQAIGLEKNLKGKQNAKDHLDSLEDDEEEDDAYSISLEQRAWPFLEMLKTCQTANADITWGV